MPSYELSLVVRTLSKPELVSTLKRTAETILTQGGILRQFTSLGDKPLPFRMKQHGLKHKEGTHFVMTFDAPSASMDTLRDELRRDIDLIRHLVIQREIQAKTFDCTLEEELQPPAYRKDVQKLIEAGKNKVEKRRFWQNSPGFDYYPFQR